MASDFVAIERDEAGGITEGGPDGCEAVVGVGCVVPHFSLAKLNADLATAGGGHFCDEGVLFRGGGAEGSKEVMEDGGEGGWGLGFDDVFNVEERLSAAAAMAEREERCLPAGVLGPVEWAAFMRELTRRRIDDIVSDL